MIESHAYLAYAPRGGRLLCALFWFVQEDDVYGWFTGPRAQEHPARFFMLEDYYSSRETHCFLSARSDLYGDWMQASDRGESRIDRPVPVPAELCPELDRLQDEFAREWLFYEGWQGNAVNIRADKLDRLTAGRQAWSYYTPGADLRMVAYLSARWGLDYALE